MKHFKERFLIVGSLLMVLLLSAFAVRETLGSEENIKRGSTVAAQDNPDERAMKMMKDLCDIAGYGLEAEIQTEAKGKKAAAYILNELHNAGVKEAKLEPIRVNSPYPKKYEITLAVDGQKDRNITSFPLQWTAGTPPEGITGQLAYVGDGSKSNFELVDVKGKIALLDEKMIRGYIGTGQYRGNDAATVAMKKGAIGIIRVNLMMDVPQFAKNDPTRPPQKFPIPVFSVGKGEGAVLKSAISSGKPHAVKLLLDVPQEFFDAYNVVVELPGGGRTDEVILVGTHYDTGMFTGAVDNNGTVALMIEWAKYFAAKPRNERHRDMIFAWCFGHDFDNNSGHYQFADAHAKELKKAIVWDVDHAAGGIRYVWDEKKGTIVPTAETNEWYIMSNNYTFTRLAAFTMEKYGFFCTQNRFFSSAMGPQWGMAPDTSPWVNVATIPIYYHSPHDTPDKIKPDQMKRAYLAHIEIIENIDRTPEGFLFYDNITKNRPNTVPRVRIEALSDNVRAGDTVIVWNDSYYYYDDKTAYHGPGIPEWVGAKWDWGDGTPATLGEPYVLHVYEKPGTYTITLTFPDTEGAQGKATKKIEVLNMPAKK
jgi:hypothetical protein